MIALPRNDHGTLYRVVGGPGETYPEAFLTTLHGLLPPWWRRITQGTPRVSLEFVGTGHRTRLRLLAPTAQAEAVTRLLWASYPTASVLPEEEEGGLLSSIPVRAVGRVGLRSASFLPLHIEPRYEMLTPLLTVLAEPGRREAIEMQVIVQPLSTAWLGRAHRHAGQLRADRRDLLDVIVGSDLRQTPTHWDLRQAALVEGKAEKLPFACCVRVMVRGQSEGRAGELLRDVAASLRLFSGPNSFDFHRVIFPGRFEEDFCARRMPILGRFVLNTEELAALWHLPENPPHHLESSRSLRLPAPLTVPRTGRVLGVTVSGRTRLVAQPIADATLHTIVMGPTGTGKSTLLLNLILQDLEAGRGLALLDPKSDLVQAVLARLPRRRIGDLVLISPRSDDRSVGINPLTSRPGEEPVRLAEHVVAAFQRVYASFWGPRTEEVLRSSLLTLIHYPGSTLAHIPKLLTDSTFRAEVVARVDDPIGVGSFWTWYERVSEAQRTEITAPLLNRLRAFTSLPKVRRLLCQPHSTVDLGRVMDGGGVILVDLAGGVWGETTSRLVGSLLFTQLWQRAQARAARREEDRRDFSVYIDEFASFLSLAGSMGDTLAQARSLRLSLTLAHQHLGQLTEEMKEATSANARTRIVFQCGGSDARVLAREFAPFDAEALMNLPRFEAALRLAVNQETTRPFSVRTVPAPAVTDSAVEREAVELAMQRFGRPVGEIDEELRRALGILPLPTPESPGAGRRPRR